MKNRFFRTNNWFFVLAVAFVFLIGCDKKGKSEKSVLNEIKKITQPEAFTQKVSVDQFPVWLNKYYSTLKWKEREKKRKLDRKVLDNSLVLGTEFLVANQKEAGNFNYQYDFVKEKLDRNDSQVRQAGALWGLSLCFQYRQTEKVRKALEKGFAFFFKCTRDGPEGGGVTIAYPGDVRTRTGTVALVALAIIEFLRTDKKEPFLEEEYRNLLHEKLEGYLQFLTWMKLEDKHFSSSYLVLTKTRSRRSSPYFDGETMLCLIKAARYLDYEQLVPVIEDSAMTLARDYTISEWRKEHDSDQTKGFFQWSCMAFGEYMEAGYANAGTFGDYVLTMAWWMIHVHKTLKRNLNTAYAYEGLTYAYKIAKMKNDQAALDELSYTIDKGMYKLTSWQVGGPLQTTNRFLKDHPTKNPLAVGGIMNHRKKPPLRIDVTQHQMHAVILALRYVYSQQSVLLPAVVE